MFNVKRGDVGVRLTLSLIHLIKKSELKFEKCSYQGSFLLDIKLSELLILKIFIPNDIL